jgi:hypothetical protein
MSWSISTGGRCTRDAAVQRLRAAKCHEDGIVAFEEIREHLLRLVALAPPDSGQNLIAIDASASGYGTYVSAQSFQLFYVSRA